MDRARRVRGRFADRLGERARPCGGTDRALVAGYHTLWIIVSVAVVDVAWRQQRAIAHQPDTAAAAGRS